jgi:GH15 family glucan-1,4-alpha-glucosidase
MTTRDRIEEYALVGDLQTAGLISRDGSVDWLCFPRFDSGACFAALVGEDGNGFWRVAPAGGGACNRRQYRDDTLILETEWDTESGCVRVIDFMPPRGKAPDIIRIVEGVSGTVTMTSELRIRFDYGHDVPWVRSVDDTLSAVAGPDALFLRGPVRHVGRDYVSVAEFRVTAGDRIPFVLTWHPSHEPAPRPVDAEAALGDTEEFWTTWSAECTYRGEWRDAVIRSLITLKGLTYAPTGGIVAAPTTSLPEHPGGVRNWDYRYCWLRDATFTLQTFLINGYREEAVAWRDWLLRAVAGKPEDLQIMYGVAGERRLQEWEVPWLAGFGAASPVRIGNAAVDQFQLDVYGEVLDALQMSRLSGIAPTEQGWAIQRKLMEHLESRWTEPDEGIWEVRGPRRHFVHSKVMAWVAADRAVRAIEASGLDGPGNRWRALAEQIHREVCERGYDADRGTFTQYYGADAVDGALLLIPQVGFLPATDPRVIGTIETIRRELLVDGLVVRYRSEEQGTDGLPPGEGAFLACTFWLADALDLIDRHAEARELFERVLALRNDVGLLAEEYDVRGGRMLGNMPQAFSHVPLVNTAHNLTHGGGTPHARVLGMDSDLERYD